VRFAKRQHARYLAYNILAGNPDFLATARAIDPDFPDPPKQLAFNRFTPETHQPGFPGGQLGKWQTRSDTMDDGIRADLKYYTLTMDWDITPRLPLESITSTWEMTRRQVIDFDGSEFTITTDDCRREDGSWLLVRHHLRVDPAMFNAIQQGPGTGAWPEDSR
jgi:hypothetical protein